MSSGIPSYTVVIPAFNAQETIVPLLEELQKIENPPSHIYVIDDGSFDETKSKVNSSAVVYRFEKNQGKGRALQKGFELFNRQTKDAFVISMDADLQHSPAAIASFLEKVKETDNALIIGCREIKPGKMPFMRFLSNTITSIILSKLTGQLIRDSQCGFRLIPRNLLKNNCFTENGFQFESEFILWCSRKKVTIDFVDIPTIYNSHGSSINHIGDTFRFIKLVMREMFSK